MDVYRRVAFVALGLALGIFLALGFAGFNQARAYEAEEQRLLDLINGYREANGLSPLVPSETLSTAATRHSEDMATYGFFSHETATSSYYPEGSNYANRAAQEGYPADAYMAENIAMGLTAEEAFETWRGSSIHNTNMLNGQYTAVGIGYVGSYWTVDFGSAAV